MKKLILGLMVVAGSLFAGDLITFTAGTPAKASEVNANFSELAARIEALEARLNRCNCGDVTDGLVAYYKFEGDANDSSGNGYNGTEYGGVEYVDGVIGKAAKFDGVDDYIRNNDFSFSTTSDFTISIWIKPKQDTEWYIPIMSIHQGDIGYKNFGDKQIGLMMYQNFVFQGLQSANNGENGNYVRSYSQEGSDWYHVVYIVKNGIGDIYLNGNIKTNESVNNRSDLGVDIVNGYLEIGALNFWGSGDGWSDNGRDKKWYGYIDDLRIYNRALSESEITTLYNLGQ